MEEINPWNGEINLLERMLNSHDLIMKEGKDDREAANKPKNEASKREVNIGVIASVEARASKPKVGASKEKVSIEDNNNNLKQREGDRSMEQNMDQLKGMLDIEIEEIWQLMMQQFKWRKMVAAGSKIN